MAPLFNRLQVLVLAGLVALQANGQSSALSEEMQVRFPDASAVFLERSVTLNLVFEGDSLKAYTDVYEDMLHLKDQTEMYTNRKVYGSSFVKVDNLKAKTLVWTRNKYREVPVSEWTRSSRPDDAVFYDDSYYYSFNYPSVASGNRTQLEYREIHKDVKLLSGFLFASYAPQAKTRYVINADRDIDIYMEVLNDPSNSVKFQKSEKGRTITYEWTAENIPALRTEPESPAIRYFEPHVILRVKSYRLKGKVVDVLSDLKSLHSWYRTFVDSVDETASPQIQSVVDAIVKSSSSELEIVKRIFYWVQNNIHYIAFEDGMRGFVPHTPAFTCEKRYGDCKDMATLIVGMLKHAGIKSYYTWIGSRDIPYRYTEFPSPYVDNHMIATYRSAANEYYFLDATGSYTSFGYPTAMIQGKEALISLDRDNFVVREVPVIGGDQNMVTDSVNISIHDNVIAGRGAFSIAGLPKCAVGHEFERVEEKDLKNAIVRLVGKGNNKFYLDKFQVGDRSDLDNPIHIDYEFRLADYYQRVGDELYINLNLTKFNYNRFINEETRKTPHEGDYKYVKAEYVEFAIPDGFEVEYLPSDESFTGELITYKVAYSVSGNTISLYSSHYIDYLLMMPSQFKTWNEEVGKLSNAYRETIILKKKS